MVCIAQVSDPDQSAPREYEANLLHCRVPHPPAFRILVDGTPVGDESPKRCGIFRDCPNGKNAVWKPVCSFHKLQRACIVPLCHDQSQHLLCVCILLPARVIALEDGTHGEAILGYREGSVENGFQFSREIPKVSVPERFGVLQTVAGTHCPEDLELLLYCVVDSLEPEA